MTDEKDATASSETGRSTLYDVAVVGLGPVGQSAALLLAMKGHNVVVIEKQTDPYPLPRAVHYDPDISRLLDQLGLAAYMENFAVPSDVYEWQTADRQTMLQFPFPAMSDQGWPASSMFNQPGLEEALRERGKDFPNLKVYRGTEVVGLSQNEDHVTVNISSRTLKHRSLKAKYVIGADGAKSLVRDYMNTSVEDLGFFYDWLIVDIIPADKNYKFAPDNLQICDPQRPTTHVSAGPGRRRFEYMRMPQDNMDTFNTDEFAWEQLNTWGFTKENCQLERRAIYTFQARWATAWRDRRIFLVGDAAHQMPPFFGQGMVSGMRDSVNLAWKLDLVLKGVASDELLDTYESERSAHVQHAIGMSVELGKVICETNPEAVAARDAHFLEKGPRPEDALPPVPEERLGNGAFATADVHDDPLAGLISVQGNVVPLTSGGGISRNYDDAAPVLLDRLTDRATSVVCDGRVVDAATAEDLAAALPAELEAVVIRVVASPENASTDEQVITVTDPSQRYFPLFDSNASCGVVVRPDYYYYGSAGTAAELKQLIESIPANYRLSR